MKKQKQYTKHQKNNSYKFKDESGLSGTSSANCSADWDEEFKGKCVSCLHASPSNRKHEMNCSKSRAISRGLRTNGGGGGGPVNGYPVHRLFGCVYWEKPNDQDQRPAGQGE